MLFTTFSLPVLATTIAVASAIPAASKGSYALYNATFDDLVNVATAASLQPVGIDKNIYWDKFFLDTPGAGITTALGVKPIGLQAQSSPNVAAYGIYGDVLAGAVTTNPFAVMEAGVGGSTLKSFDLLKFYFGCVANSAEAAAGALTACTITAQGYYASNGGPSPTAYFTFLPTSLTSPMKLAVLPAGFLGLKNVTFTTVVSNVTPALTGTLFDNFIYIGYS